MKKLALAATLASMVAAPAFADTATKTGNDPFVSTQGALGFSAGMAAIGVVTVALVIAASDGS